MDIKQILSEATNGALNDEVLSEIENVFEQKINDKVEVHVESALNEQDELYTEKLKELVVKIDEDHSNKLKSVVKAIDSDRSNKLKLVIEKYESSLNGDAEGFQTQLIESISDYLDVYLEEKIPAESVQEAVKNTKAKKILEGLRSHLAVKKKESNRLETLKEEALSTRDDVDRVIYEDTTQEIVSESVNSPYMDELSKY